MCSCMARTDWLYGYHGCRQAEEMVLVERFTLGLETNCIIEEAGPDNLTRLSTIILQTHYSNVARYYAVVIYSYEDV